MLALAEFRASRCPCGCGHNAEDTLGEEVPGRWRVKRVRCHARAAMIIAQENAPNEPKYQPAARIWWTEKAR